MLRRSCYVIVCLIAASVTASAASLDKALVSKDAKWLLFVDVAQLRSSSIGQRLREQHAGSEQATRKLAELKHMLAIESWDDLHGILFYGTNFRKGDGAVIINAKSDQQAITERLLEAQDYKASKNGNNTVHTWTHDDGKTLSLMFYPGGHGVLSGNRRDFDHAIAVLDGEKPNLEGSGGLQAAAPAGASIYLEVQGPIVPEDNPNAPPFLALIHHMTVSLVHREQDVTLSVAAVTADADTALQLQQILEGFQAVALLQQLQQQQQHENGDPTMTDATRAIRIKASDNVVRLKWQLTNEQAVSVMQYNERMKLIRQSRRQQSKPEAAKSP